MAKSDLNRYEVKSYLRILGEYRDRDWAIHSAECFASFFEVTVDVVDRITGEVITTIRQKEDP